MTTPLLTGFLDKRAAAQLFCVAMRTLDRWRLNGLAAYRGTARGKLLFKPRDIEAFLQREQRPQQDLTRLVDETVDEVLTRLKNKAGGSGTDSTLGRKKSKGNVLMNIQENRTAGHDG